MKLEFRKLGINGEGIGYLDRKPVFCPGVFPGETAEVISRKIMNGMRKQNS